MIPKLTAGMFARRAFALPVIEGELAALPCQGPRQVIIEQVPDGDIQVCYWVVARTERT